MHYFGKDRQEALRRYYEQASVLHTATGQPTLLPNRLTLKNLCNLYLDHQLGRAKADTIQERQYHERKPRLKTFANFTGRDRLVGEIKTIELLTGRQPAKLCRDLRGRGASCQLNRGVAVPIPAGLVKYSHRRLLGGLAPSARTIDGNRHKTTTKLQLFMSEVPIVNTPVPSDRFVRGRDSDS
jgi:hypothetical protein